MLQAFQLILDFI